MNPAYDLLNNNPASPAGLCFVKRDFLGSFWAILEIIDKKTSKRMCGKLCKSGLKLPNCITFSVNYLHISFFYCTFAASKVKGKRYAKCRSSKYDSADAAFFCVKTGE